MTSISKEQVEIWRGQDCDELYNATWEILEQLFVGNYKDPVFTSIMNNLNVLYRWAAAGDASRLYVPALESLINTRILVAVIQTVKNNYSYNDYNLSEQNFASELLQGAHVVIEDGGALIQLLKNSIGKDYIDKRFSSHYKANKVAQYIESHPGDSNEEALNNFNTSTPDFSVNAQFVINEFLFFEPQEVNGKICSCFQFEGHAHTPRKAYENGLVHLLNKFLQLMHYSIEKAFHHVDYLRYRYSMFRGSKVNVGQYGVSEYTETKPLIMRNKM